MANVVAFGLQWGDEGKGKVIDLLSGFADIDRPLSGWCQCRPHYCRRGAESGSSSYPLGNTSLRKALCDR